MPDPFIVIRNGRIVGLNGQNRIQNVAPRPSTRPILRTTPSRQLTTEARLIQAYLNLFTVQPGLDGSRKVSLGRFGCYDVRLMELCPDSLADSLPVWVELYDHEFRVTLDSRGCDELEVATLAAEHFLSQARQLNEERTRAPMPAGDGQPILVKGAS